MAIFKKGDKKKSARSEADASEWEKADAELQKEQAEKKKANAQKVGKAGEIVWFELRDGRNKGAVRPALVIGEQKAKEYDEPTPEQVALEREAMAKEAANPAPAGEGDDKAKRSTKGEDGKDDLSPDEQATERIRARQEERQEKAPKKTLLFVFLYPPEDFGASIDILTGKETNFLWAAAEAGEPGQGGTWYPLSTELPEREEGGSGEKDRYGRVVNKSREFERYPGEGNRDVVDNPSGSSGGGATP